MLRLVCSTQLSFFLSLVIRVNSFGGWVFPTNSVIFRNAHSPEDNRPIRVAPNITFLAYVGGYESLGTSWSIIWIRDRSVVVWLNDISWVNWLFLCFDLQFFQRLCRILLVVRFVHADIETVILGHFGVPYLIDWSWGVLNWQSIWRVLILDHLCCASLRLFLDLVNAGVIWWDVGIFKVYAYLIDFLHLMTLFPLWGLACF